MSKREKLLEFVRNEIDTEEQSGFARLCRVPDSLLKDSLNHYQSLSQEERESFKDCSAHYAYTTLACMVDAPRIDHTTHPYFRRWCDVPHKLLDADDLQDVPLLRAMVQHYKIDKHRGVKSGVTEEQFAYASSIRSIKAPELRRRVRAALQPFGYQKLDELGYYHCKVADQEFRVSVDYGGRNAQLRYVVSFPEFNSVHPLSQFGFERALGFGHGDWNFIVEQNVDDVFALFSEVIMYSFELPERIKRSVF